MNVFTSHLYLSLNLALLFICYNGENIINLKLISQIKDGFDPLCCFYFRVVIDSSISLLGVCFVIIKILYWKEIGPFLPFPCFSASLSTWCLIWGILWFLLFTTADRNHSCRRNQACLKCEFLVLILLGAPNLHSNTLEIKKKKLIGI